MPSQSKPPLTKSVLLYVGICSGCGDEPDADGGEWANTPAKAITAAQTEAEWMLTDDGRLLCENCWATEDPELADD